MPNLIIDLKNKRFGRLKVIKLHKKKPGGEARWDCVCDCGNISTCNSSDLRRGHTKSCGCLRIEKKTVHSLSNHQLYHVWGSIVQRCTNKKSRSYENYGGRGVNVYEDWRYNPEQFITWCFENGWKKGLHIDRKNNDKGYYPSNCQFITQRENNNNQRLLRKDNTTGFVGVYLLGGRFLANVSLNKKRIHLGFFESPEMAAVARDKYLIEHNSNRKLNFPKLRK